MLWSAMNRLKRNSKGFSLVELMVAVTILALFAVGIISAFSGAFQAMADSKYRTIATNLAQKELEKVKNTKNKIRKTPLSFTTKFFTQKVGIIFYIMYLCPNSVK